ncbi:MAG: YcaO-like family protein, partial [Desulfobacteraceae bacterium]
MSTPIVKNSRVKMENTATLGKDAPLEETISRMMELLNRHGFTVKESSWRNPVPHVWSVHIIDGDCPLLTTNGKGNTREAALASALGEFFERLATNFFFADYWLGVDRSETGFVHFPQERWFSLPGGPPPSVKPAGSMAEGPALSDLAGDSGHTPGLLDNFTRTVYNPHGELTPGMLKDLFSGGSAQAICALPFTRLHDGKTVFFPVNVLDNLYTSNGMAAGNTMDEAVVQALCEIMERGVKHRIIGSGIALPDIPDAIVDRVFEIRQGMDALEKQGMKIFVKDASLGGIFPVVNVTLIHRETGGCYAAFGAHPDMEIALVRTFTELLQGRSLDQLDRFSLPSLDLESTGDPQNIEAHFIDSSGTIPWQMLKDSPDHPFVHWGVKKSNKELKSSLLNLLDDQGYSVYLAEYRHLGIDVCRIVVPGFS